MVKLEESLLYCLPGLEDESRIYGLPEGRTVMFVKTSNTIIWQEFGLDNKSTGRHGREAGTDMEKYKAFVFENLQKARS